MIQSFFNSEENTSEISDFSLLSPFLRAPNILRARGHKYASSTDRYTHDVDTENCEYETARAETIEEAEALRRAGYELYDTFVENGKAIKLYSRLK